MKTALIGTGMVCAVAASVAAQQSGTDTSGLISSFSVELNSNTNYFVNVGGVPVSQESDSATEAMVDVPDTWREQSFDRLVAGSSLAASQLEAFVDAGPSRIEGSLNIAADAQSSFDEPGASTRLFHDLNIAVEDLNVFADVRIRLDGNANVNGFGRSTLSYVFRSDGFTERGSIRDDLNGGVFMVFEDVQLSFLDISLTAVTEAGTDAPVLNASADLNANWSVEIVPIPAPGSAVGLAGLGLLALGRRR